MATLAQANLFATVMNVRLASDSAGTVLKKYGKTFFFDSSPEAADGETCWKHNRKLQRNNRKESLMVAVTYLFNLGTALNRKNKKEQVIEPRVLYSYSVAITK